jgi:1-acyl-sn-glycerol-3-phosphate acyltransferase
MARIALLADKSNDFAAELLAVLRGSRPGNEFQFFDAGNSRALANATSFGDCCVYLPAFADRDGMLPDLGEAARLFRRAVGLKRSKFLLISSALIYGAGCGRQALATEDYSFPRNGHRTVPEKWSSLETMARQSLQDSAQLTILRPVTVLSSRSMFDRMLRSRFIFTLPGHDPTLQLLSLSDLAEAVSCAAEQDRAGIFNVAPDGVVPLHAAARLIHGRRLPVPGTLQRLRRKRESLEYLRYSWTISASRIKTELGFVPRKSSVTALLEQNGHKNTRSEIEPCFDEFGMDRDYIQFYGKTLFKFLCNHYWRIEANGLENVPRQGPGILVGTHRGFMPFDGVMTLHLLAQKTGRLPRFLTHPGLLKFPFLSNFMTKLGGVVASQESATRVLQSGELVGLFPEGIKGAFTYYRDAYRLQEFGRDSFVKLALKNRVPIIPFVIVGSAEIFPIFGKINSRVWTRYTEWPCLPITPTFPVLPVPLPAKWHMQFLPPLHVEAEYPPEAAGDRATVKAISLKVRNVMQRAWDSMLSRRRHRFWGSIFATKSE